MTLELTLHDATADVTWRYSGRFMTCMNQFLFKLFTLVIYRLYIIGFISILMEALPINAHASTVGFIVHYCTL